MRGDAALSYADRADFIHELARVISLLVTAKHACGDGFLPIMCKFCPKFLLIMCNFYSKFLPIMCKRLANPSKMREIG